jgi:hypothetical protein
MTTSNLDAEFDSLSSGASFGGGHRVKNGV